VLTFVSNVGTAASVSYVVGYSGAAIFGNVVSIGIGVLGK